MCDVLSEWMIMKLPILSSFIVTVSVIGIPFLPGQLLADSMEGVTRQEESQLAPLPPAQVRVQLGANGVVIAWAGTGEDNVRRYEICRRRAKTADAEDWEIVGAVDSRDGNRGWYDWTDSVAQRGAVYTYGVRAVTADGRQSHLTQSASIVVDH
jgi:hypothetical protein